ncbi:MAG: LysM domain-containing protein, partial [Dehalococcoidia bacterium]|nr:LysM domain-containing protein [Dehalococcoidia bacterium]
MAAAAVILAATGALGRVSYPLALTDPTPQAALSESPSAGYLRPPVVLATSPGIFFVNPDPPPAPAAEPTPEATPAPEPTPEPQPAFIVYTVQPGDTIASIAAAYGVGIEYILWNNPDLSADPDLLLIGQKIQIPSVNGLIYNVKLGDTL